MSSGRDWSGARRTALVAAVHAALFTSMWLFALLVYAAVFATALDRTWFAIDIGLIGLGAGFVYVRRDALGFASLGRRRGWKLVGIALVSTAAVLACQLAVKDWNAVWLDESHYLLTVREERIIPDGLLPFNIRWLVPFFAGRWNVFPVADMDAVKAINFGAFAITGVGLVLLFVRLRIRLSIAIAAPLFLLNSYLGVYGASNRLVLDASNYALFVMLFHTLIRREHWPLFSLILLVDAFNAEKAVYWIPIFAAVQLIRCGWPLTRAALLDAAKRTALAIGPTVIYFLVLGQYLASSRLEANLCFENLHIMAFNDTGGTITENVRANTFRMLWFPNGWFSVFALLGFTLAARWMKPIVLLLIPIFIQAVIACDTQRMLAYAFIVYVPFGYLYLARALADMPRWLARTLFGLLVALTLVEQYMFPVFKRLHIASDAARIRMAIGAFEILLVGSIVALHFTFFRRDPGGAPGPDPAVP